MNIKEELNKMIEDCNRLGQPIYVAVYGKGMSMRLHFVPHDWQVGDMLIINGTTELEIEISSEWEYDGDWFSAKTPFGTVEISR